jgi:hypothetical protein
MLKNTTIGELVRDLQAINEVDIWKQVMSDREINTFVIEQIRLRLQKGEMPDGSPITNQDTGDDFYKMTTQIIYAEIGRRITAGSHYTMKHTGEFYNSLELLHPNDDFVEIFGEKKEVNLFEKYGENLIDLNEDNIEKLIEKVREKYLQKLRKILLQG